jgi:hypothetical protein
MEKRARGDVLDHAASGQKFLRVGDGMLMRSDRGTWLMDLKIRTKSGFHYLQIPIGKHRAIDRLARELDEGTEAP